MRGSSKGGRDDGKKKGGWRGKKKYIYLYCCLELRLSHAPAAPQLGDSERALELQKNVVRRYRKASCNNRLPEMRGPK